MIKKNYKYELWNSISLSRFGYKGIGELTTVNVIYLPNVWDSQWPSSMANVHSWRIVSAAKSPMIF